MPEAIAKSLQHDAVMEDVTFDQVFPSSQRFRSWLHWTPVSVATRAAALLAPLPGRKVLDVGSGVGKLCLVGAATTSSIWYGVERDPDMVRAATIAAARMQLQARTRFLLGDVTLMDWSTFDAFYLFNPFAEMLTSRGEGDALTRRERYVAAIEHVQDQLARSAAGTRVVTYHGLGGDIPACFDLVHREPARADELCLWIRRATGD
jgi:SAM-dependent methyltransferase